MLCKVIYPEELTQNSPFNACTSQVRNEMYTAVHYFVIININNNVMVNVIYCNEPLLIHASQGRFTFHYQNFKLI